MITYFYVLGNDFIDHLRLNLRYKIYILFDTYKKLQNDYKDIFN